MNRRHTAAHCVALALLAVTLSAATLAAPACSAARPAPDADTGPPRLVLVVAVDQLRADYLERFRPLFSGGFRRLLERGAVFTNARFRHACTETAPGHSVLLSGRSPRNSGIVGNAWYDRALRRVVNVVEDPTVRVLGGLGRQASPARFCGFTVGDMLKLRSPRARVVGVSLKDRAAILLAGPRADAAYWHDPLSGHFVTSSYYLRSTPRWLESWNARRPGDALAGRRWQRLLPDPALYLKYAGEDAIDGESDRKETSFPHPLRGASGSSALAESLRRTPFGDELLLDLALAAAKAHRLGLDETTDLLAVSFSSCDSIGHAFGPDSQELMDEVLRLDLVLGRLFDALERQTGGRLLTVLTADHGVAPLPEVARARGLPGRRVDDRELHRDVEAALTRRFPGSQGLLANDDPLEYVLDDGTIERRGLERAEVERTVREALLASGAVDEMLTPRDLMGPPAADNTMLGLQQRAFFAPRNGDLIVRVKPYVVVTDYVGGTSHGTPYDYDRHVPIVFLGAGIAPGRRDAACGPEDIAWALGRLLGLDYPRQDAVVDLLPLLTGR